MGVFADRDRGTNGGEVDHLGPGRHHRHHDSHVAALCFFESGDAHLPHMEAVFFGAVDANDIVLVVVVALLHWGQVLLGREVALLEGNGVLGI